MSDVRPWTSAHKSTAEDFRASLTMDGREEFIRDNAAALLTDAHVLIDRLRGEVRRLERQRRAHRGVEDRYREALRAIAEGRVPSVTFADGDLVSSFAAKALRGGS